MPLWSPTQPLLLPRSQGSTPLPPISCPQLVETEHLFKALLEQPAGLARRILSKAGLNPTQLLDKVRCGRGSWLGPGVGVRGAAG